MKNKIIQIICNETQLFALSDDGEIWTMEAAEWHRIKSRPTLAESIAKTENDLKEAMKDIPETIASAHSIMQDIIAKSDQK